MIESTLTSFPTGLRSTILCVKYDCNPTPQERTYVSAFSGGLAGGIVNFSACKLDMTPFFWKLYTHSKFYLDRRFLPGVVVFSLCGYLGQASYNKYEQWQLQRERQPDKPLLNRLADSKWTPIRNLSNEQYKDMLQDKLMGVDVEISLIDDKLKELRESESRENNDTR